MPADHLAMRADPNTKARGCLAFLCVCHACRSCLCASLCQAIFSHKPPHVLAGIRRSLSNQQRKSESKNKSLHHRIETFSVAHDFAPEFVTFNLRVGRSSPAIHRTPPKRVFSRHRLLIALVPLTLVAALWPKYRIAPLTAVIVLLTPGAQQLGPLNSALYRVVEITLGSFVGLGVSLVLLPARAHGLVVSAAARALNLLQISKANLRLPTTPEITGPVWMPTRNSSAGNLIFWFRALMRSTASRCDRPEVFPNPASQPVTLGQVLGAAAPGTCIKPAPRTLSHPCECAL